MTIVFNPKILPRLETGILKRRLIKYYYDIFVPCYTEAKIFKYAQELSDRRIPGKS